MGYENTLWFKISAGLWITIIQLCQLMLPDLLEQKTPNTYKKYMQNTYKNVTLYFLLEERKKNYWVVDLSYTKIVYNICSFYVKAIFEKRNLKFFISKKRLSAPILLNWFKLVYELKKNLRSLFHSNCFCTWCSRTYTPHTKKALQ